VSSRESILEGKRRKTAGKKLKGKELLCSRIKTIIWRKKTVLLEERKGKKGGYRGRGRKKKNSIPINETAFR